MFHSKNFRSLEPPAKTAPKAVKTVASSPGQSGSVGWSTFLQPKGRSVVGSIPGLGASGRQPIHASLSNGCFSLTSIFLSLSPTPSSLSGGNEKMFSDKDLKKEKKRKRVLSVQTTKSGEPQVCKALPGLSWSQDRA